MGDIDQYFPQYQASFTSLLNTPQNRTLARDIALRWTLPRLTDRSTLDWSSLPPQAADGAPFAAQLPTGTVHVLQGADSGLWLMRREVADPKVEGRTWRHEIYVADDGCADVIGVRTSVLLGRNMVVPHQPPSVITSFLRNCRLVDAKTLIQAKARIVTEHDVTSVLDLLTSPERSLPVLFLNRSLEERTHLNVQVVASKLAGFAHVLVIMPEAAGMVGQYLSKQLRSTLDAASLYWPTPESGRGGIHASWSMAQVRESEFWSRLEAGIIRSSVGNRDAWLGPFFDLLASSA